MPDHELPAASLSAGDRYRLMTSLIIPRPIAWVSTVGANGQRNLAPFSYFNAVSSDPATVVLGLGWNADGRPKDTLRNVLETGELTISCVDESLAVPMNLSSGAYPPEADEWARLGIRSAPSVAVTPPRVADASAALECRLVHALPLGHGPRGGASSTLAIAQVVHFHVREGLLSWDADGKLEPVDPAQLAAVGRLAGMAYTRTTDRFELVRPKVP